MGDLAKLNDIRFWRLSKATLFAYGHHNMYVFAGNMAFIGLLALFPFLIVLISLSALMGQTEAGNEFIALVYDNLPNNVVEAIRGPVETVMGETTGNILTISILVALWTTLRGVSAARIAVMKAYGIKFRKTSHAFLSILVDLGLVLGAVLLVLVTLFILVTGPVFLAAVERWISADIQIVQYWEFARYVISPLVLFLALYSLYFLFVPKYGRKIVFRWPGALLSLIIWFLTAYGFSLYLRYMGELSLIYGSLAGVVALQLFMFCLALGFLLGAELNGRYTEEMNPVPKVKK